MWPTACILSRILLTLALLALSRNWPAEEPPSPFPPASAESQGLSKEALDTLCREVQGFLEDQRMVGAELLVIKNRRTVLHEVFGWRDIEGDRKTPMERNTIFNIRSMTKPITATAVQMLIDEGRIGLHDKAGRYLPPFAEGPCAAITVDHLLTHRSGLPLGPLVPSFHACKDLAEMAALAAKEVPAFEPGEEFLYSDPGADTLGALAAQAAGRPLGELLQARILDPLGMKDTLTLFSRDDPRAGRVASLFGGREGAWMRIWKPYHPPYPFPYGAQSLYCTPMDYARFLTLWMDRGVFQGRRLLSEAAVARGLEPVSEMGFGTTFSDVEVRYGRMWVLYFDAPGKDLAAPKQRMRLFGHNGTDATHAWAWPGEDLMVLYFTQSRGQRTGIDLEATIERLLAPVRGADRDDCSGNEGK